MILVKNGVPWEVAWAMDDWELLAAMVVMGERDGGEFDWDAMRFTLTIEESQGC